jgi:hypothetical protein
MIHFAILVVSIYMRVCYVRWTGIFLTILSYGFRIKTSKGFGNVDHSKANMMISEMVLLFMTIVWAFWTITFKLWFLNRRRTRKGYSQAQRLPGNNDPKSKKDKYIQFAKDKKWFLVWSTFWVLFWGGVYWVKIATSCREINRGLMSMNGYSDEGGECKWVRSNVCWHYTIEGIFRPFYWGREKCTDFTDDLSLHEEM